MKHEDVVTLLKTIEDTGVAKNISKENLDGLKATTSSALPKAKKIINRLLVPSPKKGG